MSITYPEAVTAQGNETYIWVETLANPSAPTVAELTAGVNVSCFLYDGGAVTPEQNKGEAPRRVCDTSTREKLGSVKFSMADLQYVYDPQGDDDDPSNLAKAAMVRGSTGYLVERLGPNAKEVAILASQKVNVYPSELGVQGRTKTGDRSDENAEFSITQGASLTGDPIYDAVVV